MSRRPSARVRAADLARRRLPRDLAARLGLRPVVEVVSYPKSGRTWLRTMLGGLLVERYDLGDLDTLDLGRLAAHGGGIPWFRFTHDLDGRRGRPLRPVELDPDKSWLAGTPTVLLVRDPRDVVVSAWHQVRTRAVPGPAAEPVGSLTEYVRSDLGGLATVVAWMNDWARHRDRVAGDRFVTVRYEDLHVDPGPSLRAIAVVAGLGPLTDREVAVAVEGASFDRMRGMERAGAIDHPMLRPGDADDPDSYKTRRGVVGGFRDEVTPDDAEFMTAYIEATLAPGFGYRADERT